MVYIQRDGYITHYIRQLLGITTNADVNNQQELTMVIDEQLEKGGLCHQVSYLKIWSIRTVLLTDWLCTAIYRPVESLLVNPACHYTAG